jgi:hypothetical protein
VLFGYLVYCINIVKGIFLNISENKKRKDTFDRLPQLISVLDNARLISFQRIWIEKIHPYVSSGHTTDKKFLDPLIKEYIDTVFLIIGDSVLEDLVFIHGRLKNIISMLTLDFINLVILKTIFSAAIPNPKDF